MVSQKHVDKIQVIVLETPDVNKIRQAKKWLHGAAMLLADASNGCEMVERIAKEAQTVALMAEIAQNQYESVHTK